MADKNLIQRAIEIMREDGVACDCSWPGGDHAPECRVEAAWADAMEWAAEEIHGRCAVEGHDVRPVVEMDGSGAERCVWCSEPAEACGG